MVRVPIIYLPFIYIIALFAKDFDAKKKYFFAKDTLKNILIFFSSTLLSAFVFQPLFWGISYNDLSKIFLTFMDYQWDGFNYYLGQYVSAVTVAFTMALYSIMKEDVDSFRHSSITTNDGWRPLLPFIIFFLFQECIYNSS